MVVNLLQPSLDAGKRIDPTYVINHDHTVRAPVESAPTFTTASHDMYDQQLRGLKK